MKPVSFSLLTELKEEEVDGRSQFTPGRGARRAG